MREAPPPSYRKTLTGFEPVTSTAKIFWQETKLGAVVKMTGTRPRNLGRFRLYWKMLSVSVDNLDAFDTPEQLHSAVKACLGYGRWLEVPGASRALFIEDSISFASMKEEEFVQFFDRAAKVISKHWLKVPVETLLDEARKE